jgi:pimeloyl-ACP methyl ester carboxylesterase
MPVPVLILIIILGLFIVFSVVAAVALSRMVAYPKWITIPDEIKYEKEKGMWKNFDEIEKEEYILNSYDGYELHMLYIPAEEKSDKYVIISHGYTGCRLGSVKYFHLFHDLGFNAVLYDDRGHGDNVHVPCTMGFKESRDLMEVIKHVYERFGDNIVLGLHGESMGSALTNNALQYKPRIDFIVSDCGYNDLMKLYGHLVNKNLHLPKFYANLASLVTRIFFGYAYKQVSPIKYIRENEIPICFFHGEDDSLIPCSHAKDMHEANKGYSELYIVPGAEHAMSVITDEASYRAKVKSFLEKIGVIDVC